MSAERTDVAVIGGGPAGMAAAIEAAKNGANTVLIDYRDRPGGNYYKELRPSSGKRNEYPLDADAVELAATLRALSELAVPVIDGTTVWSVFSGEGPTFREGSHADKLPFTVYLDGPHAAHTLEAKVLIVAPGVYDRSLPFPGWTLPGILSPGGAQLLLKNQGLLPGKRILVTGTGPLLLPVAASLAEAGAKVVALLDTASMLDGWQQGLFGLWGQWNRLREAWGYIRMLRRHRVPVRFRHAILKARGHAAVEAAVIGRVDSHGRPVPGTEQELAVDTICCGYGFTPNTSLTLHLGCEHTFDPDLRAQIPSHDEHMASSVPGVFVAGDVTGIGGKDLARIQGAIAGIAASVRLGLVTPDETNSRLRSLRRRARREERFRNALWSRFRMRPGLLDAIVDDTMICRCEAVPKRAITEAIEAGYRDLTAIKRRTRAAMGPCQGRYCASVLSEILAQETGSSPEQHQPLKIRPPIMPVRARNIL